jgi:hypothetical protein
MRSNWLSVSAAVVSSAVVMALAGAPLFSHGADHLDAPGLTSPSGRNDADINDVFVFDAHDPSRTAIAATTHPAAGVISPLNYATDVDYIINVDRNGDAVQDLAYVFRFGAVSGGSQPYTVTRYTGVNARTLNNGTVRGSGRTGSTTSLKGDGWAFAGLRSDPFFFDLAAFRDDVLGTNLGRSFCDQPGPAGIDFFSALNTNGIVIEVPDDQLGDHIGVFATTRDASGQVDRMGRPAINTVFNKGDDKNAFNHGQPKNDYAGFSGNVIHTLEALGGYSEPDATGLAHVLLPDVLTYDTSTHAVGPLNGRRLTDDVIDAELGIVTHGAVPSDCVAAHSDYQSTFPYLGNPHA